MSRVEELERELAQAKQAERARTAEAQRLHREQWLAKDRPYTVKPMTRTLFHSKEEVQGAYVSREVSEDGKTGGMFYFRTDENILTHEGGGTYVLQTPKLCSDAEWASILEGNIPAKFVWGAK